MAIGLAIVALTSIDEFQRLADGIYGLQAIAPALGVTALGISLLASLVRRVKR
jgi:hypothetical protein